MPMFNSLQPLRPSPRTLCTAFAAALLLASTVLSQGALAPIGYLKVTVPAAPSASTPSQTAVSAPLYDAARYFGAVTSVNSATSFTCGSAAWAARGVLESGIGRRAIAAHRCVEH